MAKLGIDFGTTNTTVSLVDPVSGLPKTLRIDGEEKIPSVLYFMDGESEPHIGAIAYSMYEMAKDISNPEEARKFLSGVISGIKRDMRKNAKVFLPNGTTLSYAQILAKLFAYIKKRAEESLDGSDTVTEVCITHPVVFENEKKEILQEAASLAGFTHVKLLMEPIAASIGYESVPDYKNKGILVYDFGGGTFDLAYVKFDANGDKSMLPPLGDSSCGGEDIDKILYAEWDKIVLKECSKHIAENDYELNLPFLKKTCQQQKEFLSRWFELQDKPYPLKAIRYGKPLELIITKNRWDELIDPIIEQTIILTRKMVDRIKQEKLPLDKILLIGGSSRLPNVSRRLKDEFGFSLDKIPERDVAVALGASIFINTPEKKPKKCFCRKDGHAITTAIKFCPICGTNNIRYDYVFEK